MKYQVSIAEAVEALAQKEDATFVTLLQHGTMRVELYAPLNVDMQTPHKQDELYIVASGSGTFFRNGEKALFKKGDVLFVPAGMEHRFEDFTDDFSTWVIFYGAEGGEKGES